MIETELENEWLSCFSGLSILLLCGLGSKSLLLGSGIFRRVFLEDVEELLF
jgi:hypothetical protein